MKHTFGQALTVTLFGESHGPYIGATLDGLAAGIPMDEDAIREALAARRPRGSFSTARHEADVFQIISGVFDGYTTGAALTLLLPNTDTRSADYATLSDKPRPGHADYTAHVKYHGYRDYRGGGQFSGRLTAALVAVGAIVRGALAARGIHISTHIASLGDIVDEPLTPDNMHVLASSAFPTVSAQVGERMQALAEQVHAQGDSLGGTLQTLVIGMPAGVGEPFFDSVESVLSHMLFSIPAIKGVSFGDGFAMAAMRGSEANDAFCVRDGRIMTETNHNGGINGGITNGMPLRICCAVKPTPSIYKEQRTVSLSTGQACSLRIEGRHDSTIVHRVRAVVDAACALALGDLLTVRFGTDYLFSGVDKA